VRVIVRDTRPANRKHLTAGETLRLLAEIPAEYAGLAYLLATAGARISEALTATYGGMRHDADVRPELRFNQSKTEAGLQPIPLTPETARMLTRRRTESDASDDALSFPNSNGNAYDRRAWTRRYFKPAAKRARVPWASPHQLRHGVATLMAERGYQAHDIARMLRHADGGALALKTYIHSKVRSADFVGRRAGRQHAVMPTTRTRPALNRAEASEAAAELSGVARTGRSLPLGLRVVRLASRAGAVTHVTGSSPTLADLLEPTSQPTRLPFGFVWHHRPPRDE
jgi:hypothetical protein